MQRFLTSNHKNWDENTILDFVSDQENADSIGIILKLQRGLMENWEIKTTVIDFKNESIIFPNATENKAYTFSFDEDFFIKRKIDKHIIECIEDIGLVYNQDTFEIKGNPCKSGNFKINLLFKAIGELDTAEFHVKEINLVINPDPKSLWKDIPSDVDAIYWKEDDRSAHGKIVDKKVVISSKRGRSHENIGSFRDDDFAFKNFEEYGWGIVVVSDGAGSAPLSRKGSQHACTEVIKYFEDVILPNNELEGIEKSFREFSETKDEVAFEAAKNQVKNVLYKGSLHVHNTINGLAMETFEAHPDIFETKNVNYKAEYFHSTLIFTAIKKFQDEYLILSFGVGDCPIGIVNKDRTDACLLNWLDVGEFGGGTRFITQPDIFHSKERPMSTRFNVHIQQDFSFLFLMTDGIYDPKFEVEANLEKTENWLEFIADLEGENEDNARLDFENKGQVVEENLNHWMDFWSKGNHDDRTLAIIY